MGATPAHEAKIPALGICKAQPGSGCLATKASLRCLRPGSWVQCTTYNPRKVNRNDETSHTRPTKDCGVSSPVKCSREPERVVRRSELVGFPAFFELGLLRASLDTIRADLVQAFLFCIQKSSPLLQSEKLEENVCKVEPAGDLQQLLRIQQDRFSENWKSDRSWNDVVNAQVIQLFRREIR